jgi:hypothetical protein
MSSPHHLVTPPPPPPSLVVVVEQKREQATSSLEVAVTPPSPFNRSEQEGKGSGVSREV